MKKIPFDINAKDVFEEYATYSKDKGIFSSFKYVYSFAVTTTKFNTCLIEHNGALFYVGEDVNKNDKNSTEVYVIGKKDGCDLAKAIIDLKEEIGDFSLRVYEGYYSELKSSFLIIEDRNSFEYIYSGDDLRLLEGRKYHSKRGHISTFIKLYPEVTLRPCKSNEKQKYIDFISMWKEAEEDVLLQNEKLAAIKSLDFIGTEGYISGVLEIEGKIIGFSAGIMLDDDTALIMFEKADADYKGIYAFMNQAFLKEFFPSVKYVNRDQDLGIEGLRKSKESYYPTMLKKVYLLETN